MSLISPPPGRCFRKEKRLGILLWVIFYCYSVCAALVFQKVLLPLVPSMHAAGGLLPHDAVYFDTVARQLAEHIRTYGWGVWTAFPAHGAAVNVAILGALYALFGPDPALILPVNCAIHSLGGVLVFLVTRELASQEERVGVAAGILAGVLFVVFPSALNWYGQIHKDGFAIAGFLLILLTWLRATSRRLDAREWLTLVVLQVAGLVLLGGVRPYGVRLMLVASLGLWLAWTVVALLRRQLSANLSVVAFFTISVIFSGVGVVVAAAQNQMTGSEAHGFGQLGDAYAVWGLDGDWQWRDSSWLPDSIESYVETAARTRAGLISYGISEGARSLIDKDIAPTSVVQVLLYLPRALQIALLAPFPDSWLTELSLVRHVALGEMIIYYLCIPGLILLLRFNRGPAVFVALYFAFFFLTVFGFITANLGTLYRLRYGYLFVLLAMGVLGWLTWLKQSGRLEHFKARQQASSFPAKRDVAAPSSGAQRERQELVGSGLLVMALTFLGFLGFFVRDVLMANTFGLGTVLDDFFVALMIPMFVVAVLSVPLGTAFIPVYLAARERLVSSAAAMVSDISFRTTLALLAICLILGLTMPFLLPSLRHQSSAVDETQIYLLSYLALPILLLSGALILGNAVLNAHGRVVLTSAAQLVVPVVAIVALFLFGEAFGVAAVMAGMIVGQVINLVIVQACVKGFDASLLPRFGAVDRSDFPLLWTQYLPLMVSALFVSLAAPVATLLSISLPDGSVSALNLGTKVVLFMTGLVGAAISSVMLPYFSSLMAKNQLVSARRELSFFMLASTFVAVPISAGLFFWSEPIVRLMFERGGFHSDATAVVTRVMQYAVVQLPFFVSNSLLLKFATATKHVIAISVAAIMGLGVNIAASMVLMKHMGVAGIALGSSLSVLVSTIQLVAVLVVHRHVTVMDAIIMFLNWLLFVTLLISLHFQSTPSVCVTAFTYAVLLAGYLRSLLDDPYSTMELRD